MPRVKLDAAFCLTARCEAGKKRTDFWDTSIPGFVYECRCSGRNVFVLRYTNEYGKQCQRTIGTYGDITYDQARRVAQRWRSEVVLGEDPAAKKAQKRSVATFATLAQQVIEHNAGYQRNPANAERIIRCHLVPQWGSKRLDEIKAPSISTWLAQKRKVLAPATVEKLRVTMNRMFELAAEWNMAGASPNPVKSVKRVRFNNRRDKYLTADEAKRLLAACDASLCKQLGSIVRLLLLTGARKMELLRAKWSDVDLERRAWHIPETKTGVPRYVPLSSAAVEVIEGLRRWETCEWLIPNPETRKPYTDLKRPWDTAREKAGLPDLRLHDCRHSAASFLVNSGVDLYAVGKILGHADHQSTMRYAHLANDTLLAAVEAGAAKMTI